MAEGFASSSQNKNYKFNLLLGFLLKRKYGPDEVNEYLLTQLKTSEAVDRPNLYDRMFEGTLKNARKKTRKKGVLLAYLLDRWARSPGTRDCNILMNEVFSTKDDVKSDIKDLIQYFDCNDDDTPAKTTCGTSLHLEIGKQDDFKGKLFVSCRGCETRSCVFNVINDDNIKALHDRYLRWSKDTGLASRKRARPSDSTEKKYGSRSKKRCPEPDSSTSTTAAAASSSAGASGEINRLYDGDLLNIKKLIGTHATKWFDIGLHLGFKHGDLKNIKAHPSAQNTAPISYLQEMLAEWLQWAPSDGHGHVYANVQSLQSALRESKLGVVAETFEGFISVGPMQK